MLPADLAARLSREAHSYAVTGAGGWLGRATLELLATLLGKERFSRHVVAYGRGSAEITLASGAAVSLRSMTAIAQDPPCNVVLHFAGMTPNRLSEIGEGPFTAESRRLTETVLTALRRWQSETLFFASSGAAEAGSERSTAYGCEKRRAEDAFADWAGEAGATCVVSRIFSVTAPHAPWPARYVLGSLVEQACGAPELVITARHPVYRSYTALDDVMGIVLSIAAEKKPGVIRFDAAGEEPIEMGQLAERVREAASRSEMPIRRSWDPNAPADTYVGDPAALRQLASQHGVTLDDLPTQIRSTITDYWTARGRLSRV